MAARVSASLCGGRRGGAGGRGARHLAAPGAAGGRGGGLPPAGPAGGRAARMAPRALVPDGEQGAGGEPQSAAGEMLSFYLREQPHLFEEAVEQQLQRLEQEAEAAAAKAEEGAGGERPPDDQTDLVLNRRMEEVRLAERSQNLQDVMYYSVADKFRRLGISMLGPLDGIVDLDGNANLEALTEGVHSVEALEMVRNHLMQVLSGPGGQPPPSLNAVMKISKLQAAQVYAASIMFGYFLRRVDKRFQLDRMMGTLADSPDDMAARLEKIFNAASSESYDEDDVEFIDFDAAPPPEDPEAQALVAKKKGKLQEYVESFDQETLVQTANIVSAEAAVLVERQSTALFGSIQDLQAEMQAAVGEDSSSVEELLGRLQEVVENDMVKSLTLSVSAQRRIVLEAVAYGTFLRDIESQVQASSVGLLTTN